MARLLAIFFISIQFALFASDPIGIVIAKEGGVKAVLEEEERELSVNSKVFVDEVIDVGVDARAQIEFTDGSVVTLIPDTQFRMDVYHYREFFRKDKAHSDLFKGGLRVLSGSIAKKSPKEYQIKTPEATIGLRGTIVEAMINPSGLYVGVIGGRVNVSNDVRSVVIGVGEEYRYVRIPGRNVSPELIVQKPEALERNLFSPPKGGLSIEQVEAKQKAKIAPESKKKTATTEARKGKSLFKEAEVLEGQPSTESVEAEPDSAIESPTSESFSSGGGGAISGGC